MLEANIICFIIEGKRVIVVLTVFMSAALPLRAALFVTNCMIEIAQFQFLSSLLH